VSFIRKWLRPETTAKIGLRPHRNITLEATYDEAYSRVLEALDATLGANVTIDDRKGGLIEAAFGLINSERVRVSFDREADGRTLARIEAFYPAGAAIPERSRNVEALADALEPGITA